MPRANRFYIPSGVWHITHRCHNCDFLLKFDRDRLRWKFWLFQAKKRFGISVLNYMVTSNHVHLLVRDTSDQSISRSIQLIAGRVGQEYNRRKSRKGAFWEDRYFATAVATDQHLFQCLVYIDLNMVRAGVVTHPCQWKVCGYNEIQAPPMRYRIIDLNGLSDLTGFNDQTAFRRQHRKWVESHLNGGKSCREPHWTESVAVGTESFVESFKSQSRSKLHYRSIAQTSSDTFVIKEAECSYQAHLNEKRAI